MKSLVPWLSVLLLSMLLLLPLLLPSVSLLLSLVLMLSLSLLLSLLLLLLLLLLIVVVAFVVAAAVAVVAAAAAALQPLYFLLGPSGSFWTSETIYKFATLSSRSLFYVSAHAHMLVEARILLASCRFFTFSFVYDGVVRNSVLAESVLRDEGSLEGTRCGFFS